MARNILLLFPIIPLIVSPSAFAQLSPCLERKLPIPSLGDELRQRREETLKQLVSIDSVAFEGEFEWPEPIRAEVTKELKQRQFDASKDWVAELENEARGVLQNHGYFQADPRAAVQVLQDDPLRPRVSVTLRDDHLVQFRLGEVSIRNSKEDDPELVFPREQLRELIPIQYGEIFSTQKIRQGLEALRRLYGSKGYVDFAAVPITELDGEHHRIRLILEMDEQKQFLVEKVEIFGLNPNLEKRLRESVRLNLPLNNELLENFFKENKVLLPAGASMANVGLKRDIRNGTVSLLFDFRPCPRYDPPVASNPAAGLF